MNRLDIRTRIRTYLRDTDSVNYHWTDAALNLWINDVEDDIARSTEILRSREGAVVVANESAFFDAPEYTIDIKNVSYRGVLLPPITTEEAYVFSSSGNWEDDTLPEPMGVILEYGRRRFRVFPAPAAGPLDVTKFGINISRIPTAYMTVDTDSPQIPKSHHVAIVYGVVAHAYMEDFDMRHPDKARMFMELYLRVLGLVDKASSNRGEAALVGAVAPAPANG